MATVQCTFSAFLSFFFRGGEGGGGKQAVRRARADDLSDSSLRPRIQTGRVFPPVMAAMSKTNCFGKRSSCFPTFQLTFVSTSRRVPTLSDQQRSPPASFLCVQSACHRYHSKHRPSVSCQPSLCAVCTSQIPQQAQTVCVLTAFSVSACHRYHSKHRPSVSYWTTRPHRMSVTSTSLSSWRPLQVRSVSGIQLAVAIMSGPLAVGKLC